MSSHCPLRLLHPHPHPSSHFPIRTPPLQRHPFLIELLGAFKDTERLFLAMDYCAGGELYSFLITRGVLDMREARFVIASVTLMIEFIHARGFAYRDLKPENLMITQVS